jgi:hypothetical protein
LGTSGIHHGQPFHLVAAFQEEGHDPHPLGDVEAEAPEVDDVAASARRWRALEEDRLVPEPAQPIRQRRAGDACPVDRDSHAPGSFLPVAAGGPIAASRPTGTDHRDP